MNYFSFYWRAKNVNWKKNDYFKKSSKYINHDDVVSLVVRSYYSFYRFLEWRTVDAIFHRGMHTVQ